MDPRASCRAVRREAARDRSSALVALAVVAIAGAGSQRAARAQVQPNEPSVFQVSLDGGQVAPPAASPAIGDGLVYLDAVADTLHYHVAVTGLTGVFVSAAIVAGKPGQNGTQVGALQGGPAVFDGTLGPLSLGALLALHAGDLHVVVRTTAFPAGEVRGQITPGRDQFVAFLDGSKCAPPNAVPGTARAELTVDPATRIVQVAGEHAGLSGPPLAVEVRAGPPGTNGPLLFTVPAAGATAFGGALGPMTSQEVAALRSAEWYLTIPTAAFPGGEVRGPIVFSFLEYGDGCPGATGPVTVMASGYPTPGGTFHGSVANGPPLGFALVLRSLTATELPVGYGCPLYLLPPLPEAVPFFLDAQGGLEADKTLSAVIPTPCRVHVQVLGADAGAPNGQFYASNGLVIDITD